MVLARELQVVMWGNSVFALWSLYVRPYTSTSTLRTVQLERFYRSNERQWDVSRAKIISSGGQAVYNLRIIVLFRLTVTLRRGDKATLKSTRSWPSYEPLLIINMFGRIRLLHQKRGHTPIIARSFAKQTDAAAKSKKSKTTAASSETGRDKDLELVLAALNAPQRVEPEVSPEEKARRYEVGRNYVIGRFEQHNEFHHDLACKIQMKKHGKTNARVKIHKNRFVLDLTKYFSSQILLQPSKCYPVIPN